MSLALTLMVMKYPFQLGCKEWSANISLEMHTDYRITGQVVHPGHRKARVALEAKLSGAPQIRTYSLPPNVVVGRYDDEGERRERTDPYGQELRWTYARNLKQLVIPEDADWPNKAIKAFIDQCPDNTAIVLYFH
ncbi:MAG TPA: hypothetical protein VMT23_00085 [Candidatus Binatia bacterium]|nr:hypothetical protein [Candidatus Binatia bacterium]